MMLSRRLGLALLAWTLSSHMAPAVAQAKIEVAGTQFVVDGQAGFLVGVSLFDALGSTPPRDADLDAIRKWGIRVVRVWAHWKTPIYGTDGTLTQDGRERLGRLVRRLDERRLILELVLLRPGQLPGEPFASFAGPAARRTAVEEIATALKGRTNVLFDLYNEHDHSEGPISHAEARTLRDAVKRIDPGRIVTISSTEYHILTPDGRIDETGLANLAAEAGTGAAAVGVDVLAVHFPRTADWSQTTGARIAAIRKALQNVRQVLPIYLSEEKRDAEGEQPIPANDYLAAARLARQEGAAGWVFHTSAGFALAEKSFLDALTTEERRALSTLGTIR